MDNSFHLGALDGENELIQLSVIAIDQALKQAKLPIDVLSKVFLSYGTSVGGMKNTEKDLSIGKKVHINNHWSYSIDETIKCKYQFKDSICFTTACTSSGNAIKFAKEIINAGLYDIVIAGGVDNLCDTTIHGFNALGVLSQKKCTPFAKDRTGMNIGEGAAFLVIESEESVKNRGIEPLVELAGCGSSSDAFQITAPDVVGVMSSMQNAVIDARVSFDKINYINAHGTGTMMNDKVEATAIENLSQGLIAFSSTKHITGHLLGAASAIETVISTMCLQEGIIPGNTTSDTVISANVCRVATKQPLDYVLSNSLAFGGNNVSLLFGRVK